VVTGTVTAATEVGETGDSGTGALVRLAETAFGAVALLLGAPGTAHADKPITTRAKVASPPA
jgi:hypothetical protein